MPACPRRTRTVAPEEHAAIAAAAPPAFRDLLTFLAATGVRPHLAYALEARHVDWHAGTATLESKRRPYTIYLTDEVQALLRRQADRYPTGPLLRNTRGEPWTRNAVRLQFRALCRKAGIPQVTAYAYRHTAGSTLLQQGAPPAAVAALLGHADLAMLSKYYNHTAANQELLRRVAREFAPGPASPGGGAAGTPPAAPGPGPAAPAA